MCSVLTSLISALDRDLVLLDQTLASLLLGVAVLLDTDGIDHDEASGVAWCKVANLVHGALAGVVQLLRVGPAADAAEHALEYTAAHATIDLLLRRHDAVLEELALRREVQAVVEDLGVVEGDELVTQGTHLAVHDETLEVDVGTSQHSQTRSLVAASGLETNEAVLDNVDTAHTVLAGNRIGSEKELDGVGHALLAALVLQLHGQTFFKGQGEVLGAVGCLGGVSGELPHVCRSLGVGVLQDASLVAAVCQVLVHAPWLALCASDGNALLCGVVEQILTTLEALVEDGVTPWSNDLDGGLESVEGEFEADLVVALASAAVGDGEAALLLGDCHLRTSNDGTSERSSEKVDVLVDGIARNGGEAELLDKLNRQSCQCVCVTFFGFPPFCRHISGLLPRGGCLPRSTWSHQS